MFKLIVIVVILLISSFLAAPYLFVRFAIWDASNPDDDNIGISKILYGFTPHTPAAIVKQSIDVNSSGHIVDVRTKKEYNSGYIKSAINIPEETVYEEIPKKFPDKGTHIYLYCDTGYRGATVTRLLRSMGYENASNIENGLKGWERTGLFIVRPNSAYF